MVWQSFNTDALSNNSSLFGPVIVIFQKYQQGPDAQYMATLKIPLFVFYENVHIPGKGTILIH